MEKSKFFEAFLKQQKNPRYQSKSKSNLSFYFQINIDQAGLFYIRIVGGNLREKRVNSDNYSGDLKECIDLYYSEKERIKLVVDWSNPNCRVYLNKNPQILEKLIYLDNLIDDKGKSIYPVLSTSNVKVEIRQFEEFLNCSVVINGSKIEHFICDRWVVSGQKLYSVLPVGQEFKSAIDLNATIKLNELNNYLTILNSNFKNIKIDYKGYRVEDKGVCELLPAVVIEGIDESAYLTISTTYSYKEYITPKFYSMYRPEILTIVNKESETFETYKLELPDFDILDKLINILFFIENKYNLSDSFSIEESGVILNPNISHILFNSELKIVVDNFTLYGEKILLKHKIKTISPNLDLILRDGIDFLGKAV